MPATPERIGFITQQYRLSIAGPDTGVVATFGTLARDVSTDEPIETFFSDEDDVTAMAVERLALLNGTRRYFPTELSGAADYLLNLDNSQTIPVAQAIDPRASVDRPCLVMRVRVDLATGKASVGAWG